MTRAQLAKRTGVPEPTIKDVELGRFKLSFKIAMRICIATGVDAGSLLRGDEPLLDLESKPVTHKTRFTGRKTDEPLKQLRSLIYETACKVADDHGMASIVQTWIEDFLIQSFTELGLNRAFADKLEKLQSSKLRFSQVYLTMIREGRTISEEFEAREKLKRQRKSHSGAGKAA